MSFAVLHRNVCFALDLVHDLDNFGLNPLGFGEKSEEEGNAPPGGGGLPFSRVRWLEDASGFIVRQSRVILRKTEEETPRSVMMTVQVPRLIGGLGGPHPAHIQYLGRPDLCPQVLHTRQSSIIGQSTKYLD